MIQKWKSDYIFMYQWMRIFNRIIISDGPGDTLEQLDWMDGLSKTISKCNLEIISQFLFLNVKTNKIGIVIFEKI